jgi:hypothetical protein
MIRFPDTSNASFIWSMTEVEKARQGNNFPGDNTYKNAMFGYGSTGTVTVNTITRFDNTGTYVGSEESAGTARVAPAAASFNGNQAMFGFGSGGGSFLNTITKFNGNGTYVGQEENAGTSRSNLAAASYGRDNTIFGFGTDAVSTNTNTITRFDISGTYVGQEENAGRVRRYLGAATYGGDKAIFGYGVGDGSGFATYSNEINKFDNNGTFISPEITAGTTRYGVAAATYGGDKAIFGYGFYSTSKDIITRFDNTGTYVGTQENAGSARYLPAAATYGGDKAIFGFGTYYSQGAYYYNVITRFDNTGAYVGTQENAGTARFVLAAASYG